MGSPGSSERQHAGLWPARALVACVGCLLALTLAAPLVSGDLWWHLRLGSWMLDHGTILNHEPFSHTLAGQDTAHWTPQEWGSEVVLAWIERSAGIPGLKGCGAALALLTAWLAARLAARSFPPLWAACACALFAALYALKWELRPHLFSAPLFLALVHLLFDAERPPDWRPTWRTCVTLFALGLGWVCLHAEALFAALLPAAGLGGALVARFLEGAPVRRVWAWSAASAAGLAGVCSSPLFLEPLRYALASRAVPARFIEEWFRPWILPGDPRFAPLHLPLFALVALLLVGASLALVLHAWARVRRRERRPLDVPLERLAFCLLCLLLAWSARRYFWLLWFPALELLRQALQRRHAWSGWRAVPAAAGAVGILILARGHYTANALEHLARGSFTAPSDARYLPRGVSDLMREAGIAGRLFHPYEWGGYLLWAVPAAQPFLYGETVLFGDFIEERWRAERDEQLARECFARREIEAIVMPRVVQREAGPVAWRPPVDADGREAWVRAFADQLAVLWLRADDEVRLGALERYYAEERVPFERSEGFVEAAALRARPEWLHERELLPAPLAEALAPWYAAARLADPSAVEQRAALYESFRLTRSARWERAHALEAVR